MIRTVLKFAIVALVANATWQLFGVYSPNFRFTDAVRSAAQFRGDSSDEALHDRVVALAEQFEIPVTPESVAVSHSGALTAVDVSYVKIVDLAPGFSRPWPMTVHVEVLTE